VGKEMGMITKFYEIDDLGRDSMHFSRIIMLAVHGKMGTTDRDRIRFALKKFTKSGGGNMYSILGKFEWGGINKRFFAVHPDYDTISGAIGREFPNVCNSIVRLGYHPLSLQDATVSTGFANLLIARKAFKYSEEYGWKLGQARILGGKLAYSYLQRRGTHPLLIPTNRN
jgi:hypothetical protein